MLYIYIYRYPIKSQLAKYRYPEWCLVHQGYPGSFRANLPARSRILLLIPVFPRDYSPNLFMHSNISGLLQPHKYRIGMRIRRAK